MQKHKVAFIGCGIIGAGLAVNAMMHGYPVTMVDLTEPLLDKARQRVADILGIMVRNSVCTQAEADGYAASASYTTSIQEAVADAKVIQECVPEKLEIKHDTYAQVERCCDADAVIASSTTAMLPSDLQEGAIHPERILVAHPYNPSYLLPLIELCGGKQTSQEALERAKAFYEDIGKVAIICRKEVSGYIVNRASWAVLREARETVVQGCCSVEDMDKAIMYGPGLRMAITGQLLTISLGVEGGMRAQAAKYGLDPKPDDELIASGVEEELANRPAELGSDEAGACAFRDKMIIEILRLQNMI